MTAQEQATAHELLEQIKTCARQEPEKALTLAQAYQSLMQAAETRSKIKK